MAAMRRGLRSVLWIAIACVVAGVSTGAQWVNHPMAGAPRTRDGKVNLTGPVPRLNGKPDLSGIWQVQGDPRPAGGLFGIGESLNSRYFRDVLADFKPEERPLTPYGVERLRQHTQPGAFNPTLNCLPDSLPTTFRQIFMDGRKHPADTSPTWQGYSVGKWEGDTLVIDTVGFNDRSWLDARGTGHSEEMRIEERFRRRDFGHMDLTITITDPKTFTRPITFSVVEELLPDTDLLEHYCVENEKDDAHMPGRERK